MSRERLFVFDVSYRYTQWDYTKQPTRTQQVIATSEEEAKGKVLRIREDNCYIVEVNNRSV